MSKRLISVLPLICLAGTIVASFFVNLSGIKGNTLASRFYFATATLDKEYFWTMYNLCTKNALGKFVCTAVRPAFPYSPATNFDPMMVPKPFSTNVNFYYYMLRVSYGFLLVALAFEVASLIPMLEIAYRGLVNGLYAYMVTGLGLLLAIVGAVLSTVVHVKGVNTFKSANVAARVGVPMFICMWVGVFGTMIAFVSVFLFRCKRSDDEPMHFEEEKAAESIISE
ncbi:hypothetical protein PUMCH_002362 [Australozyma saopauloensis]|uniref:Uncharacterized protein n=1 Tax=Australozyma saopauloensis TaxID=291208 RepID=A0AAX4H915_9ASCO|nr:hypothetical protein PUMCH_002362 [[Candida] saopauloensis]